ncbi:HI0074 family nucleotidyltransferase substrate-binding subunit [Megamonas hypermegale]|uniref:HI0074 family nucleotidyltransferase substrate-binding subunit n=1 Tax=Megamonas hypermegale TaxID=158847 RepID=UPI0026EDD605|nr:HI0074 family nucleotidyltransferase substrate-binding subunit [Megamonas hypermegale]
MQKYNNFSHHLNILSNASNENLSNEFIISGIYYKFGIQFDLSWKLFKELLAYEGISSYSTGSPREIIKAAYKCYDFIDEDVWLSMLKARNTITHIYDSQQAHMMVQEIITKYIPEFQKIETALIKHYGKDIHQF